MKHSTRDLSDWRARTLRELLDHPDVLESDGEWLAELGDAELELLIGRVRDAEDLADVLDELRSQPDRER